ncbi:MAG: hypothetical protein V4697_02535 [Patescibacteria group bacterium]
MPRKCKSSRISRRDRGGKKIAAISRRYCHNNAVSILDDNVTPAKPSDQREKEIDEKNQARLILFFLSDL